MGAIVDWTGPTRSSAIDLCHSCQMPIRVGDQVWYPEIPGEEGRRWVDARHLCCARFNNGRLEVRVAFVARTDRQPPLVRKAWDGFRTVERLLNQTRFARIGAQFKDIEEAYRLDLLQAIAVGSGPGQAVLMLRAKHPKKVERELEQIIARDTLVRLGGVDNRWSNG